MVLKVPFIFSFEHFIGAVLRQILMTNQCGSMISWLAYISSGGNLLSTFSFIGGRSSICGIFCLVFIVVFVWDFLGDLKAVNESLFNYRGSFVGKTP